ncbi:MAG: recombinase family protein, partial [Bacteroidota bacterium]
TRVSTKEQANSNTSLSTQKRHCEIYAKSNGYDIVGYFGGTHESAKSDDRKEFKRMLKYAKQSNSVGYIIVYSYDRFSRTGSNASQITSELLLSGIQVKAVSQEVDTMSPSGKFQQNIFYMFSQFDNELRRDKTITAMTDLLRKGHWMWAPPRGYVNKNKHHKVVEWQIEINEEGLLLKKAFQWKLGGRYSNTQIVKKLNQLGMNINEKRIHEIFKNPFYCGIIVCKMLPEEVNEGKHPKIVSQEDFLAINSNESNHPHKHIKGTAELPLKQFAHCEACKTPLTGFLVKQKGIFYYKCRTNGCSCTKSASQLHKQFETKLNNFSIDDKYYDSIKEVIIYTYDSMTNEIRNKEAYIKKQISELQQKLDTLQERFVIGEIEKELYVKFSEKFKNEINQFNSELINPEISSSNLQKALDKALTMSQKLSEIWVNGNLEQKQQIQKLVYPSGIGYDKQKDRVQTKRVNSIFASIPLLAEDISKIKSGEPIDFNRFSALVTPTGFKPVTLRAEI